jgi:hypothetical protein
LDLPDLSVVRRHLQGVFIPDHSRALPFVDPVLFEHTLRQAYEPDCGARTADAVSTKACIFAFLSIAETHFTISGSGPSIDMDAYASEARALMAELFGHGSLAVVQLLNMLVCITRPISNIAAAKHTCASIFRNCTTSFLATIKLVQCTTPLLVA